MDVIVTNSTQVDSRGFLDLTFVKMNESLYEMEEEGYFVHSISDRRRGSNPAAPSYSVLYEKRPEHIETKVFLRDSVATYYSRLADMKSKGYRLISHSFCDIRGSVETTSVYIRDRRLLHNISIGRLPKWESYLNLSFLDFTRETLRLSPSNMYPSFIETNVVNRESRFSIIFLENLENIATWYRWGVDTDDTIATLGEEEPRWEPRMSTSYNYNGMVKHFFLMERRRYFY